MHRLEWYLTHKPKMTKERWLEIRKMRDDAGTNEVIPEDEWSEFWHCEKYYGRNKVFFTGGYRGQ